MHCKHFAHEKEWSEIPNGILKLHPVCSNCGTFKNVSSDKGKKLSNFIIVLSELKKYCKITDVQLRLILKDLEKNEDFCDTWWISYEQQKKIFITTVKKYLNVNTQILDSLL
ncbi:MAG: hypothetical protein NZ879_06130 [Archaeoglobaceae archaeon]|nr:hypothetical protein [Archaeoglobaceae archaeon]MDW8118545.1 hypothetical protein [Archaeoglobaceae archaeon]